MQGRPRWFLSLLVSTELKTKVAPSCCGETAFSPAIPGLLKFHSGFEQDIVFEPAN